MFFLCKSTYIVNGIPCKLEAAQEFEKWNAIKKGKAFRGGWRQTRFLCSLCHEVIRWSALSWDPGWWNVSGTKEMEEEWVITTMYSLALSRKTVYGTNNYKNCTEDCYQRMWNMRRVSFRNEIEVSVPYQQIFSSFFTENAENYVWKSMHDSQGTNFSASFSVLNINE